MKKFFVDADISRARTISTEVYKSAEFFEMAKEQIFAGSWQLAGDTSMVSDKGSCYPFILLEKYLDEPLLITRDDTGSLHCLSNVCTHRGNLLVYESCKLTNLKCRYHGRLFQLDGRFKFMPEFKEVKDF
ncbi:MAG: aromatic ring-hydroxylating oxygenase subunit alpha, partial [Chitinophagaceae bacterium]